MTSFKILMIFLCSMLSFTTATQSWALDPQSAQQHCEELRNAARAAQMRYIQTYQPHIDPGKTFDEATSSCLDFIARFHTQLPNFLDHGVLTNIARKLLLRTCESAHHQFDKAVSDALRSVNDKVKLPKAIENMNFQNGDATALPPPSALSPTDRIINRLK